LKDFCLIAGRQRVWLPRRFLAEKEVDVDDDFDQGTLCSAGDD
jgi:hypothetical protein